MSRWARLALDGGSLPPACFALFAYLAGELPTSAEPSALRCARAIVWG